MLEVRNLTIAFGNAEAVALDHLSLDEGERVGLVGESGSGKTLTSLSIAGLHPAGARVRGSIRFLGHELVGLTEKQMAVVRGREMGMVFQDPLRALNPVMRVGKQVQEVLTLTGMSRRRSRQRAVELLAEVDLPEPDRLARRYPHQLSGGQRQRVMIAIAVAARPRLLIADEPTTALDVTVQRGILDLLVRLSEEHRTSMLFVSHDLGVVKSVAQRIAVMYGGQIVESGPAEAVIEQPRHRYTEALIGANPVLNFDSADAIPIGEPLRTIRGSVSAIGEYPVGCRFRDRCEFRTEQCASSPEPLVELENHRFSCWHPVPTDPRRRS